MIGRRPVLGGLCSCSALALLGCATGAEEGRIAPGFKPLAASDEGGLWDLVGKTEEELKHSRALVRDKPLNEYLTEICRNLAGEHAPDLRVYVLRTPYFNASMAPNGMMQVWTGLLLRAQNEAQVAAVLGHEIGHYLERHTLQRWRDTRLKSDVAAFLGLGLSAAGFGKFGDVVNLTAMAAIMAFSRAQEREADAIGFELMEKAGYRPIEASLIWENLLAERKQAKDKKDPIVFFASHPASEERAQALREKAAGAKDDPSAAYAERWRTRTDGLRAALLGDEVKLRQPERSLVVFEAQRKAGAEDGRLLFAIGEVHRLRDETDDRPKAIGAYERALAHGDCPVEAHRSLGLVRLKAGDKPGAEASLRRYLELRPDAADAAMIRTYLPAG
jgi:predicted Zn-dependent protease